MKLIWILLGMFVLTMCSVTAAIDDYLIHYYDMEGDSVDSVGGLNGADTDITYPQALIGQAANFNGVSSYIDRSAFSVWGFSNSYTIATLFNLTVAGHGDRLLEMRIVGGAGSRIEFYIISGKLYVATWQNSGVRLQTQMTTNLPTGGWHYVSFVWNGTNGTIYLDGTKADATESILGSVPTMIDAARDIVLGADNSRAGSWVDGQLDELKFYNSEMTEAEALTIYQTYFGEPPTYDTVDPPDTSTGIPLTTNLSLTVYEPNLVNMTVNFTFNGTSSCYYENVINGTNVQCNISTLDYKTTYQWSVNITGNLSTTTPTFSFTTDSDRVILNMTFGDIQGITNATYNDTLRGIDGIIGGAINFNHSSSTNIRAVSPVITSSTGTINVWARLNGLSGNAAFISFVDDPLVRSNYVYLLVQNDYVQSCYKTGGTIDFCINFGKSGGVPDTDWHMYTLVQNGTQINAYIDGVEMNRTQGTASPDNSSWFDDFAVYPEILYLGVLTNTGSGVDGDLDDTIVYNRNLSAAEVVSLYQGGTPTQKAKDIISDNIAYYTAMDELYDFAGSGQVGLTYGNITLTNLTHTDNNAGFVFDGIDDQIRIENYTSIDLDINYSISLWFKANALDDHEAQVIIHQGAGSGASQHNDQTVRMQTSSGNLAILIGNDASNRISRSMNNGYFLNDTWYNVIMTYNTSGTGYEKLRVYVDAVELLYDGNYTAGSLSAINPQDPLLIGRWNWPGDPRAFNGTINDIIIFDKTLDQDEIDQIFNATTLTPPTYDTVDPADSSVNISITTNISLTVYEADLQNMTVNFTFNGTSSCYYENVTSGTNVQCDIATLDYETTYQWSVNITNNLSTTTPTFSFTTIENIAPTYDTVDPTDYAMDIPVTTNISLTVYDVESDTMTVNFTFDGSSSCFYSGVTTGTNVQCDLPMLDYYVPYQWSVNISDGTSSIITPTFNFNTTPQDPDLILNMTFGDLRSVSNQTDVGTLNSITGKIDGAINFNGIDNKLITTNYTTIELDVNFSVSLWIKGDVYNTGVLVNLGGVDHNEGYRLQLNQGSIASIYDVGGSSNRDGRGGIQNTLDNYTWYHIVSTWSPQDPPFTRPKLYVDGTEIIYSYNSSTFNVTERTVKRGLYIGGWHSDDSRNFNGTIDDVIVYNGVFTQSQVTALYQSGSPTTKASDIITENIAYYSSMDELWDFSYINKPITVVGNITLTNVSYNINNSALLFDGKDDYINLGNTSMGSICDNGCSICHWVKPNDPAPGTANNLFTKYGAGDPHRFLQTRIDAGTYAYRFALGRDGTNANSTQLIVANTTSIKGQWVHLCMVFNGSTTETGNMSIYENGLKIGEKDGITINSQAWINSDDPYEIGYQAPRHFNGSMDDLLVFTRGLTASEVYDIYNPLNGTAPTYDTVDPADTATGISITTNISLTVYDSDLSNMTVNFTFEGSQSCYYVNVTNGTNVQCNLTTLSFDTVYSWSAIISDELLATSTPTFTFTTLGNIAPSFSDMTPTNGSIDVSDTGTDLSIIVYDVELDAMDVNFTFLGITQCNYTGVSNGTQVNCSLPDLNNGTTYDWNVTITDATATNTTPTINFTTDFIPYIILYSPDQTLYGTQTILINFTSPDTNLDTLWYFNTTDNVTYSSPHTITLPDGIHTLYFYVNDTDNNQNQTSQTFRIDTSLPTVIINYPAATDYDYIVTDLNYTTDAIEECWYNTGGANSSSVPAGTNFTNITSIEGSNTWSVYCNNSHGTILGDSVTFNSDLTAPTLVVESPIPITYNTDQILINITTTDAVVGVDKVWYYNGTDNVTYSSEHILTLGDGNYTFDFYVNDTFNHMNSTNVSFIVDTTAPALSVYSPDFLNYTNNSILINLTASDLFLDSTWYWNGTDNVSYSSAHYDILADGNHSFIFYANDTVNNLNTTTVNFTVDITPPVITIASPENISYGYINVLINFSAVDNFVGVDQLWYFDESTNVSYTTPVIQVFGNGGHTLIMYANDTFNNIQSQSISFNVDTTIPTINITSPVSTNYSTRIIDVNYNTDADDSCWYNNGTTDSAPVSAGTNYSSQQALEGDNNWTVYCNNTLGVTGSSSVFFTTDTIAPTITVYSPNSTKNYVNGSVLINFTGTDVHPTTQWFYDEITNVSYTVPFYHNVSDGDHSFIFYINDTLGNLNQTIVNFTVDTVFPTINIYSPSPTNNTIEINGTTLLFNMSFSDTNLLGYNVTCIDATSGASEYSRQNITVVGSTAELYEAYQFTNPGFKNCTVIAADDHTRNKFKPDVKIKKKTLGFGDDSIIIDDNIEFIFDNRNNFDLDYLSYKETGDRISPIIKIKWNRGRDMGRGGGQDKKKVKIHWTIKYKGQSTLRTHSPYPGHSVIIPEGGLKNGYWIDANNDYGDDAEIEYKVVGNEIRYTAKIKEEKFKDNKFETRSIGGLNTAEQNFTFEIVAGKLINFTATNFFNGIDVTDWNVTLTDAYNGTRNYITTTTNISNVRVYYLDTTIVARSPDYYNNNNTVFNGSTMSTDVAYLFWETEVTVNVRDIITSTLVPGVDITVFNLSIPYTDLRSSSVTGGELFKIDTGSYNISVTGGSFPDAAQTFNVSTIGAYTETVYVLGNFSIFIQDEATEGDFNLTSPDSIVQYTHCTDGTVVKHDLVTVSYQFVVPCAFEKIRFVVNYPSDRYYRTLLPKAFDIFANTTDVKVWLVNLDTHQIIFNTFELYALNNEYINTKVYFKKFIGDTEYVITSDYLNLEEKIGTYFLLGEQYNVEIEADNYPTNNLGFYTADTAGEKIIRLFEIEFNPSDTTPYKDELFSASMDESTGTKRLKIEYFSTAVESAALVIYNNSNNVSNQIYSTTVLASNASVFYYIPSTEYENETFIITLNVTKIPTLSNYSRMYSDTVRLNSDLQLDIIELGYITPEFLSIVLLLMLTVIALIFSFATADIGSLVIVGLAGLFYYFGWLGIAGITLALAVLIAVINFIKKRDLARR